MQCWWKHKQTRHTHADPLMTVISNFLSPLSPSSLYIKAGHPLAFSFPFSLTSMPRSREYFSESPAFQFYSFIKATQQPLRDAFPFQNRWIFGKVPNSLWPRPPSFSESYIANFLNWLRSLQKMEPIELPSWKCTLFWFLSIQLLKNITWKDPFVSISWSNSPA